MSERPTTPMNDWTAQEHIAEACRLLEVIFEARPDGSHLALIEQAHRQATCHALIAEAKQGRS